MKVINAVKIVGSALVVLASLNAYAQASDADAAASATPAASAKAQKKAVRSENRALQRKVRAALTKAGGISTSNITVRARGGDVTLQGSVPEQGQSDKATEAAQGVAGVKSVKNALAIRPQGQ